MWRLYGSKKRKINPPGLWRILYVALIAAGCLLIVTASRNLLTEEREYSAARSEYKRLREYNPIASAYKSGENYPPPSGEADEGEAAQAPVLDRSPVAHEKIEIPNSDYRIPAPIRRKQPEDPIVSLTEINPDFIGWIYIEGIIDYPVVKGRNNSRYLNTTFTGQRNASGTIFMDYRQPGGFLDAVCILYGHNMRDGSMFAPLKQYLVPEFMEANPEITVATSDGELLVYKIFAARQTDIQDKVYRFSFSDAASRTGVFSKAPDDARGFLLLSTCTNSSDRNDRLLVYAALID